MNLETSEERNAIECAKWVVVNALVSDISVKSFENTFAAIEIMQSYEAEVKIKDLLVVKSGLAKSSIESSESCGIWWMTPAEFMPDIVDEDDKSEERIEEGNEKGLTPLHRAILNKDPPETVKGILEENPDCLDIRSAEDRTSLECAKAVLITALLEGKEVASMKNTFAALQIMQGYDEEGTKANMEVDELLPRSTIETLKTRKKGNWSQSLDKYNFIKCLAANSGISALGEYVDADNDSAIQPHEYFPPANLKHVSLRINLPAGFRRVRRAILDQKSSFLPSVIFDIKLRCTEYNVGAWDKYAKHIGRPQQNKDFNVKDFKGAKRKFEYRLPKTSADDVEFDVNETMELLEYNDFCFTVKGKRESLDLNLGNLFETHTQMIFIDKGLNSCRLIASMEVRFPQERPTLSWQIKNTMRFRSLDYFNAIAESICEHSVD